MRQKENKEKTDSHQTLRQYSVYEQNNSLGLWNGKRN